MAAKPTPNAFELHQNNNSSRWIMSNWLLESNGMLWRRCKEKSSAPLRHVHIRCSKTRKACATAHICENDVSNIVLLALSYSFVPIFCCVHWVHCNPSNSYVRNSSILPNISLQKLFFLWMKRVKVFGMDSFCRSAFHIFVLRSHQRIALNSKICKAPLRYSFR